MMQTVLLSPEGPHNDDHTRQVADTLSEAVRVLNHATGDAGITYPSTIYEVLGRATATIAGLDQLLEQLGQILRQQLAFGRLGDDRGNPADKVDQTLTELFAAREAANTLTHRLDRVFNSTSGLHLREAG